jgi:hypothetical protein
MICPASLKGVGSMQLLNVLLQETMLLPIYKDVVKPVHVLFETAGCGLELGWLQAAWREAAAHAKDEHALRRMHMTRQLQEIADLLMVSPWQNQGIMNQTMCNNSKLLPYIPT